MTAHQHKIESSALERGSAIDLRGSAWQVFRIMAEFVEGYQFLSKFDRQITVMGSARTFPNSPYYQDAVRMGALLVKEKFNVITGGGPGIMEAANKGAFEAGGMSIGINIQLPHEQRINAYVRESRACYYFLTRKVLLTTPSQAFVFYPGGFGSLDELFEVLDNIRSGHLTRVPLVLVGKSYWEPLLFFLRTNVFARVHAITEEDLSSIQVVDSADEAMEIVNKSKPIEETCSMDSSKFCSDDAVNWRVFRIMAELVEGFEFLRDVDGAVTMLGTARVKLESKYYGDAHTIGRALAQKKIGVITGGGEGIAEASNKGAYEAGGQSYGMDMWVDKRERINPYITKSKSYYFPFTRKLMLTTPSRGFILFPGGYGTLNLCFELLTLIQTEKIKKIPVVLYGKEFWEPLLLFIKENQFEKEHCIAEKDLNFYQLADSPDEALRLLGISSS